MTIHITPANPPSIQETPDSVKVMLPPFQEPGEIIQFDMQNRALAFDQKPREIVQLNVQNMALVLDRKPVE